MKFFENIAKFLKIGLRDIKASPEITINFSPYTAYEHKEALRLQWEDILKSLEADSSHVLKREWNNHEWSWERTEIIHLQDEGLIIKLSGVTYPMPGEKPKEQQPPSRTEYNDRQVDQILGSFINSLSQASQEKKTAIFAAVSVAAGKSVYDPELINRVTDNVVKTLMLRSLLKGEQKS